VAEFNRFVICLSKEACRPHMDRVLLALKWLYETSKCCCGGKSSGPDNTDTKFGALNLLVASFCTSLFIYLFIYFSFFMFVSPLFQEKSTDPDDTNTGKNGTL
jgi:hypothetical protein